MTLIDPGSALPELSTLAADQMDESDIRGADLEPPKSWSQA